MKTLLTLFKLFPLLLAAIRAVEEAFPLPSEGKRKLALVLDVLKLAYEGGLDLAKDFTWDRLVSLVVPMIARIVGTYNDLGIFTKPPREGSVSPAQ